MSHVNDRLYVFLTYSIQNDSTVLTLRSRAFNMTSYVQLPAASPSLRASSIIDTCRVSPLNYWFTDLRAAMARAHSCGYRSSTRIVDNYTWLWDGNWNHKDSIDAIDSWKAFVHPLSACYFSAINNNNQMNDSICQVNLLLTNKQYGISRSSNCTELMGRPILFKQLEVSNPLAAQDTPISSFLATIIVFTQRTASNPTRPQPYTDFDLRTTTNTTAS